MQLLREKTQQEKNTKTFKSQIPSAAKPSPDSANANIKFFASPQEKPIQRRSIAVLNPAASEMSTPSPPLLIKTKPKDSVGKKADSKTPQRKLGDKVKSAVAKFQGQEKPEKSKDVPTPGKSMKSKDTKDTKAATDQKSVSNIKDGSDINGKENDLPENDGKAVSRNDVKTDDIKKTKRRSIPLMVRASSEQLKRVDKEEVTKKESEAER